MEYLRKCRERPVWPLSRDGGPMAITILSGTPGLSVFYRISRMLARHIKSVGLPHMKLSSLLRPGKVHLGIRTPGVDRIPVSAAGSTLGRRAVPWTAG
jgi:hypothetical protein